MARPLAALLYVGGKSALQPYGIGKWVASLVPQGDVYLEPFAGMLGVLLQRPRARREIVNDLNQRVINWWRTLQHHPDELIHLFEHTPRWAADLYYEALEGEAQAYAEGDTIKAAYYYSVNLSMGFGGMPDQPSPGEATLNYQRSRPLYKMPWRQIVERVRSVEIDHIDACDFIEKYDERPGLCMVC